jgi:hypothetical protein
METVLIKWLASYTQCQGITSATNFTELNYDVFDEAMTVDFVNKTFGVNVNTSEIWFTTVGDLLHAIAAGT